MLAFAFLSKLSVIGNCGYVHTVTISHRFLLFGSKLEFPWDCGTIQSHAKTLPCAHSLYICTNIEKQHECLVNIVACHTIPSVTKSVLQLNQSQYNVELRLPNISPLQTRCRQWSTKWVVPENINTPHGGN